MNKELVGFLVVAFGIVIGVLKFTSWIQDPFIGALNEVKNYYHESVQNTKNSIDEHFSQQETILKLQIENQKYKENNLLAQEFATELNSMFKEHKSDLKISPKVQLVKTLSYAKFGDINRVWLDMQDYNTSKVYGLVSEGVSAGIVTFKHNQPMALLNSDYKCSYTVYIGKKRAPGIVHGKNTKEMVVEFIPNWIKIEVGDEVFTSGLDNLFFTGLRVGRVLKIGTSQGFQNATIQPYFDVTQPGYFHVIMKRY
ncbi:rod shape-determining protein MreC [Sulfurimonas sp. MAG313]|nr:rod shape-determining protein MreC [Sulfurimonas sp. MAG313]MDF1882228.1 rod shape-determining protein MreC [Sulfurimonas sp. MAG313]